MCVRRHWFSINKDHIKYSFLNKLFKQKLYLSLKILNEAIVSRNSKIVNLGNECLKSEILQPDLTDIGYSILTPHQGVLPKHLAILGEYWPGEIYVLSVGQQSSGEGMLM